MHQFGRPKYGFLHYCNTSANNHSSFQRTASIYHKTKTGSIPYHKESPAGCFHLIWEKITAKGLSTGQQYGTYFGKWILFSETEQVNPFDPPTETVLAFLSSLYEKNTGYSAINTGYSAINTGYSAINTGYNAINTGYNAINTGYSAINTGYNAINTGYSAINTGYNAINTGYSAINTGYSAINTGYNAINTGYSAINTGYNAINTGYSAINTGYSAINTGYNAINTAKSAISSICSVVSNRDIDNEKIITCFMRGIFKSRPSLLNYTETWDVNMVFKYLETLSDNKDISLLELSQKTAILLMLLSGQRC